LTRFTTVAYFYLRQGGYDFIGVSRSVCLAEVVKRTGDGVIAEQYADVVLAGFSWRKRHVVAAGTGGLLATQFH